LTPYVPGGAFDPYVDAFHDEADSIRSRDIFALQADDTSGHFFRQDYDEGNENPFVLFLKKQAEDVGVEFSYWYASSSPSYEIGREEAEAIVGGDANAAGAIVRGIAVLADMPKELRTAPAEGRAAWANACHAKWLEENKDFIDGLDAIIARTAEGATA